MLLAAPLCRTGKAWREQCGPLLVSTLGSKQFMAGDAWIFHGFCFFWFFFGSSVSFGVFFVFVLFLFRFFLRGGRKNLGFVFGVMALELRQDRPFRDYLFLG